MSRELIQLGQETLGSVAQGLATGAGAVRLQLIASRFYEALRGELERTPSHEPDLRAVLVAATDQCRRVAEPCMSPPLLAVELRTALALLNGECAPIPLPPVRGRPQLRVIQGGLA